MSKCGKSGINGMMHSVFVCQKTNALWCIIATLNMHYFFDSLYKHCVVHYPLIHLHTLELNGGRCNGLPLQYCKSEGHNINFLGRSCRVLRCRPCLGPAGLKALTCCFCVKWLWTVTRHSMTRVNLPRWTRELRPNPKTGTCPDRSWIAVCLED